MANPKNEKQDDTWARPGDRNYGDTRSPSGKALDTGERQADNLGPVPPAGYKSKAIADAYATPGNAGTGEKPKWNAAIVTSWDEQHPENPTGKDDALGEDVDVEDEEQEDFVPETDAARPIDQPKRVTPPARVGEDGRPDRTPSRGRRQLSKDQVVEVEKARDEAQGESDAEQADPLKSAYAKGE